MIGLSEEEGEDFQHRQKYLSIPYGADESSGWKIEIGITGGVEEEEEEDGVDNSAL